MRRVVISAHEGLARRWEGRDEVERGREDRQGWRLTVERGFA